MSVVILKSRVKLSTGNWTKENKLMLTFKVILKAQSYFYKVCCLKFTYFKIYLIPIIFSVLENNKKFTI